MKKIKKILCVLFATAIIFTSMPVCLATATQSYNVKITWRWQSEKVFTNDYTGFSNRDNGQCGISLFYKDSKSNSESEVYWNVGKVVNGSDNVSNMVYISETGHYIATATISGLPTRIYIYADNDDIIKEATLVITKIEVGSESSSNFTTFWSGSATLSSVFRPHYIELYDGGHNLSDSYDSVETTYSNWNVCSVPEGYNFETDKYHFRNINETIDKEIYTTAFGKIKGGYLYQFCENGEEHGHCYGMASTTAALLSHPGAIGRFSCKGAYAKYLNNINKDDESDLFGVSVKRYIKFAQMYQYDNNVENEEKASENNLEGLYGAIKAYVTDNADPLIINVRYDNFFGDRDPHAVFPYGIAETDEEYIILVYDSNDPNEQVKFVMSKDFSTWSYLNYSSDNSCFTYSFPGNTVYNIGLLLNNNGSEFISTKNTLVISTNDVSTKSELNEIYSQIGIGDETEEYNAGKAYWLADDVKLIELSSLANDNKIVVSDINTSIQVVVDENEKAELLVDDSDYSYVELESSNGKNNEIIFTTNEDDIISELVINATADGDKITATQTDTGLLVTGVSDGTVTLSKDDEIVEIQEIKNATGDVEIIYDKTSEDESVDLEYHAHSYTSEITTPATHTAEGVKTYMCECGDSYTESIAKIEAHTYDAVVTDATCTEEGYTTYTCECGDTYTGDKTPAKGHNYAEGVCENCGDSKIDNCSCNCHKSGFMGFIWKIINFFQKLFRTNKTCSCGVAHY